MTTVKCLTVWQPWAWLLVAGHKDVENRSWYTPYRGPLLIHAGKKFDWDTMCVERGTVKGIPIPIHASLSGAIVGAVQVVDCLRGIRNTSIWHEHGQHGIYVRDAVEFANPIPYRGRQGLFDVALTAVPELAAWLAKIGEVVK